MPHDWSVELPYDKEKGQGCTGFLLGGTGWYRKHFMTTEDLVDKKVILNFDGIYNRSNIYCNGNLITFHPNGYSPCLVDISKYLNSCGEDNCVAVKVDRTSVITSYSIHYTKLYDGRNQGTYSVQDCMLTPGKFSALHMRSDKLGKH